MEEQAKQRAYLRFGVISPLLTPEPERSLARGLAEQAQRTWQLPDGRQRCYAASTIEDWLYRYRNGGLEALVDPPRRDRGTFPGIPETLGDEALRLFREHPGVRTGTVYEHLKRNGLIVDGQPSRSTFYRWAAENRPEAPAAAPRERRAFEAGWSGALWQADIMYGPLIAQPQRDGRRRQAQTYLVAIIDDYSRLLCEGRFFFTQGMEAWLEVLRAACCRRGIPEKLYCDYVPRNIIAVMCPTQLCAQAVPYVGWEEAGRGLPGHITVQSDASHLSRDWSSRHTALLGNASASVGISHARRASSFARMLISA